MIMMIFYGALMPFGPATYISYIWTRKNMK